MLWSNSHLETYISELLQLSSLYYRRSKSKKDMSVVRSIMNQIIRKYCDEIPIAFVSRAASEKAVELGIADLYSESWKSQARFDKGRKIFQLEHKTTVSDLIKSIIDGRDVIESLRSIEQGWILKEEDKTLRAAGYQTKRINHDIAYEECGIQLIYQQDFSKVD
jgi:hypothetical protein